MSVTQRVLRSLAAFIVLSMLTHSIATAAEKPPKGSTPAAITENRDIANTPAFASTVESIVVTPKSEKRATVAFQLKRGAQITPEMQRQLASLEGRVVEPSRFEADVDFDFEAFAQDQQRRADLVKRGAMVPIFRGRSFVGLKQVVFVDPAVIRRSVLSKAAFRFPIDVLAGIPITVDPSRELMVTDLSVVEDSARTFDSCTNAGTPMGAWTFGKLMTDMANGTVDPSVMVEDWLKLWTTDQAVNSFIVPNRAANMSSLLINTWKRTNGKLDLSQAPLRLLAIVNRIDLRENTFYGGGGAGEGRFVFGVLDPANCQGEPQFTVILEYGVPKSGCLATHDWGQQWHALGSIALGTPQFNAALQAITDVFAGANADPSKPNGSSLNQLRTDEVALGFPWELREFHLDATSHGLVEAPVKQTPELTFNMGSIVTSYINANEAAILAGTYVVPADFPTGSPFLGANAPNDPIFWNGSPPPNSNDARQQFSLGTCNGCHGMETSTPFLHVHTRSAHAVAQLSEFLRGNGTLQTPNVLAKPDPVSSVSRPFGDLVRRQEDLDALLGASCKALGPFQHAVFRPLNMTH
jgi:hypothetical protein